MQVELAFTSGDDTEIKKNKKIKIPYCNPPELCDILCLVFG